MKSIAKSTKIIAGQLNRLEEVPKSNKLCLTISEFLRMMKEVVDFIEEWLKSWPCEYSIVWDGLMTQSLIAAKFILIVTHKKKAIELRKKLNAFSGHFDSITNGHLLICELMI